jgi:putative FmdB family regulatory protein
MPLYEYRCSKCEKKIEVIRKFSDPPLTEHEGCGGTLEQLLSAPAFQLKGTGWYVTDYAKAGAKPTSGTDGKAGDSKDSEAKTATSKDGESKAGEKSTGEKKSSETKSGEMKSKDSKSDSRTESKPAATTKAD